jgi:hypothetical protein
MVSRVCHACVLCLILRVAYALGRICFYVLDAACALTCKVCLSVFAYLRLAARFYGTCRDTRSSGHEVVLVCGKSCLLMQAKARPSSRTPGATHPMMYHCCCSGNDDTPNGHHLWFSLVQRALSHIDAPSVDRSVSRRQTCLIICWVHYSMTWCSIRHVLGLGTGLGHCVHGLMVSNSPLV